DLISSADKTVLLRGRLQELQKRLADATEQKINSNPKPPDPNTVKKEEPKPPPPQAGQPGDVIKKYLEDGRSQLKNKDFMAAKKTFTECLKVDSKAYDCAKLLGSAYA